MPWMAAVSSAGVLKAPPGLFKQLDDQIVGDVILIGGKQLFVDELLIEKLEGVTRALNQPVKHPKNPFITLDKPKLFSSMKMRLNSMTSALMGPRIGFSCSVRAFGFVC
jgi:hypothetical protein